MSIEAMKQALEALECLFGIPEQFTGKGGGDVAVWTLGGSYRAQQAIPALRQSIEQAEKQEPVAWMDRFGKIHKYVSPVLPTDVPLYATPQQRTWVGLTVMEAVELDIATNHPREFAAAIEAKLKDKNGFAEEKNT